MLIVVFSFKKGVHLTANKGINQPKTPIFCPLTVWWTPLFNYTYYEEISRFCLALQETEASFMLAAWVVFS